MMLHFMLHRIEEVTSSFVCVVRGWGLTVSLIKSQGYGSRNWADTSVLTSISMEGGVMDLVEEFQYLGSIISTAVKMTIFVDSNIIIWQYITIVKKAIPNVVLLHF